MIKCIASDMDGTLLNERQEVSAATIEAIKAVQAKGIDFVICSGRSYREVRFVLDKAEIECPAICVNGGEIRDEEGNITYSAYLDGVTSMKITNVFESVDMYFELYTPKGTFTSDRERGIQAIVDVFHTANPSVDVEEIIEAAEERYKNRLIQVVDDYRNIYDAKDCEVNKFLAFSLDEQLLFDVTEKLKNIEGIEVTSSGRNNIEVMHKDAKKGLALKRYVESKGISLADTMALGDNYNDLSMLEIVGHSVAMGNAEPAIKTVCKHVTETNENEGVAKAITMVLEKMK